MDPCLCDLCVGITYADHAHKRIVMLRETIQRWQHRTQKAFDGCGWIVFAALAAMLLGFVWHAVCLMAGWHDPTDHAWLYGGIVLTLASSITATVFLGRISDWLSDAVRSLEASETDLVRAANNAATTRGWLRDIRDCRRSA